METRSPSSPSPQSAPRSVGAPASAASNTLRAPVPELAAAPEPLSPLEQNRRITQGYGRIAQGLQALLDPSYRPGGTSRVLPNWYAFAPHASQEVGKGLLGAAISRRIIDAAQGEAPASTLEVLIRAGFTGPQRLALQALSEALTWYGLPRDVAAALASLQGAMNLEALTDPRTLWATAQRFAKLYIEAPGLLPLAKAEAVVLTLERFLNEGNVAIFSDIGTSGEAYLAWRQNAGGVSAERVLTEFFRPRARPEESRRAFTYALAHAQQQPRPSDFAHALPGVSPASMVVAAFALYEQARLSPGPALSEALISVANNFIAHCEQFETVQPAFTPPVRRADEVPRGELLHALTPLLTLEYGTVRWNFTDWAATQGDRDGRLLTSRPTEYNWALFQERWPAILHAFEVGYQARAALWASPPPLVRPDGSLTGKG